MVFIANERLRKYLAFENGTWIHAPNMPEELMEDFVDFVEKFKEAKAERDNLE